MASKNITTQPQTPVSPQMIVQQLAEQFDLEKVQLPDDENTLWSIALESEIKALAEHLRAGLAYKKLRTILKHGEFLKGLKDRGIGKRSAQDKVAAVDLFIHLSKTQTSAHFTYSQLVELTRLPEQKILALEESDIEEFSKQPVRALKQTVKEINEQFRQKDKLEIENERLKRRAEKDDEIIAELRNQIGHMQYEQQSEALKESPLVSEIKARVPELTEIIKQSTLDVASLAAKLSSTTIDQSDRILAAQAIYHFVAGPYMQLGMIIKSITEEFGELSENQIMIDYGEHEWQDANDRRDYVIDNHQRRFNPHLYKKSSRKKGK